jgi:hypothetical protein
MRLAGAARVGHSRAVRSSLPLALAFLVTAGCYSEPQRACVATEASPQLAVAGYSVVEAPPASPRQVTLLANPALVDGDVGASAGIALGYGPAVSGDSAFRDVGADVGGRAPIHELRVWVDRPLPPEVSGAYGWDAFWSEDNLTWTPIPLAGAVRFGATAARFEIPMFGVQARYVKVVTRPLAAGITTDPRFASVLVTEIQAFGWSGPCP